MRQVELQEFFIEGRERTTSHVLMHINEPSSDEINEGLFFALFETNQGTAAHVAQIKKLIDDLEKGIYGNKNDENLESMLECINRRSGSIIHDPSVVVHALIGFLKGGQLTLAYHGKPQALLFYRSGEDFERVNILAGAEEAVSRTELFPVILNGKLNKGDFLFVSTPHVTEYFTHDRLQKIITARSVQQGTEHISKVLSDIQSPFSFGGIVFRMLPQSQQQPKKSNTPVRSTDSLNKFIEAKKNTTETLSPPLVKNLIHRPNIEPQPKHIRSVQETPIVSNSKEPDIIGNKFLVIMGRTIVQIIVGILIALKYLGIGISKFFIIIFILITNKNNSRREMVNLWQKYIDKIVSFFRGLAPLSKIILLLICLSGIILAGSISASRFRDSSLKKQKVYEEMVNTIRQKKTDAEARMIYHDDEGATKILLEAKDIVANLPADKKDKKIVKEELGKELDTELQKLQKMTIVSPTLVSDLSSFNTNIENIVLIDDTILAYNKDGKTYSIDLKSKQTSDISGSSQIGLSKSAVPKEEDEIIFIKNDNAVAGFNKESKTISIKDINFPVKDVKISNIFIYNTRLYTLDLISKQIYKHSKTQTGYDQGQPWLKSSPDLNGAVSFAIDSELYLLKENGEILKFSKGNQEPFDIAPITPGLSQAKSIWTYSDIPNLYILESAHKRIVSIDKSGKLVKQYSASEWTNPASIFIDYTASTGYVLDNNKVYSFAL